MSSITAVVVIVAILCIFYSPGKVLAAITLLLIAGSNPLVAIAALFFGAVLFYFTRQERGNNIMDSLEALETIDPDISPEYMGEILNSILKHEALCSSDDVWRCTGDGDYS